MSSSRCGVHEDARGACCDLVIMLLELADGLGSVPNMTVADLFRDVKERLSDLTPWDEVRMTCYSGTKS